LFVTFLLFWYLWPFVFICICSIIVYILVIRVRWEISRRQTVSAELNMVGAHQLLFLSSVVRMVCIVSLAYLSRLRRFPHTRSDTNWPFCVDVPWNIQSVNQSTYCSSLCFIKGQLFNYYVLSFDLKDVTITVCRSLFARKYWLCLIAFCTLMLEPAVPEMLLNILKTKSQVCQIVYLKRGIDKCIFVHWIVILWGQAYSLETMLGEFYSI